jgi:hypothetical protein
MNKLFIKREWLIIKKETTVAKYKIVAGSLRGGKEILNKNEKTVRLTSMISILLLIKVFNGNNY